MKVVPVSTGRIPRLAVSLLFLAVVGLAQGGLRGPWDGGMSFYVSATSGIDSFSGGSFAAPFRTITFALGQASVALNAGIPVTVNVMPGVYNGALGESFPIFFPARGLCLEAHAPGVTIVGPGFGEVLMCVTPGAATGPSGTTPASILHGLEIKNVFDGIGIHLALGSNGALPLATPEAVEIRRCTLRECLIGIQVVTSEGWRELHVFEQNRVIGFYGSSAVYYRNFGESSPLIRANELSDNADNLIFYNYTIPQACQPRVFSNMMWGSQTHIYSSDCAARIVNNTIAFGRPHGFGLPFVGILVDGQFAHSVTIANNIIWNPAGTDILRQSSVVTLDREANNVSGNPEFSEYTTAPGFVNPNPAMPDLHLLTSSPNVENGKNSYVIPGNLLSLPSLTVRADLGNEFDLNWPRMDDFDKNGVAAVDVGADEVKVEVIDFSASGPVDAFGTIHSGGLPATMQLTLTTRPADRCGVYLWSAHSTDPVYQHTFRMRYGNFLVDFSNPGDTALIFNGSSPTGINTWNWTVDPAIFGYESEWYLQGFTVIPTVPLGDMTTRLRLELDL